LSAPRVIAIDGPAGSGKSSTASAVARKLRFAHLDSGALYRAVTLAMLDAHLPETAQALVGLAHSLPIRLALVGDIFRPEVAGVDVSEAIRTGPVTANVSSVAAIPAVREWVNHELRAAARIHPAGVVLDGRDIGTVVFPDAPLKVFLTADPAERARRRSGQLRLEGGQLKDVETDLKRRDDADSRRAVAPLAQAPDAVLLDTTGMTFEEQVEEIVSLARKAFLI
jgi:cytidylate kinase